MRGIICVILTVGLVVMGVGQAQAVLSYFPIAWNGANAFFDASLNLWTAIQAGTAGCAYYCARAWTAVSIAGAQAAKIAGTGLYYGALVGLSGLSAYMLYKGFQWVNGQLTAPQDGSYTAAPGAPGVGSMGYTQDSPVAGTSVTVNLFPTEALAKAMDCTGGSANCLYDNPGAWGNGWSLGIWGKAKCCWFGSYPTETGKVALWPLGGHTEYLVQGRSAVSEAQTTAIVAADIAGTNGSEAQIKAMGALTAATVALTDAFNKWQAGAPPAALPAPYNQIPAAGWQAIADALTSGVPQTVKDDLAAQDTPANAFKDVVNPPASGTMTKTDMASAVEDGVKAADDDLVVPADVTLGDPGTADAPTKDAIGTKLDTYWSAINNIPVLNLLTGLSLSGTGAGSPTIQVAIPSIFASEGRTYTISFDEDGLFGINYGNYLSLLGNLMLAFAGIVWTKYLFEG